MIVSFSLWNAATIQILSERTGLPTDTLWPIIEAQNLIKTEMKHKCWLAMQPDTVAIDVV